MRDVKTINQCLETKENKVNTVPSIGLFAVSEENHWLCYFDHRGHNTHSAGCVLNTHPNRFKVYYIQTGQHSFYSLCTWAEVARRAYGTRCGLAGSVGARGARHPARVGVVRAGVAWLAVRADCGACITVGTWQANRREEV